MPLKPASFITSLPEVLPFEHYKCLLAMEERKDLKGTFLASNFLQFQGRPCNKHGLLQIGYQKKPRYKYRPKMFTSEDKHFSTSFGFRNMPIGRGGGGVDTCARAVAAHVASCN
jgi:hypothetical protein